MTEEQFCKGLGAPVYRDRLERQKAAEELKQEGLSQRQIGAALGVSQQTAGRLLDPNGSKPAAPPAADKSVSDPNGSKAVEPPCRKCDKGRESVREQRLLTCRKCDKDR